MGTELLIEKRKNRCIASLLSYKDRELDKYLPEEVSAHLRRLILDELNDFTLLVIDAISNNVNEDFLIMLEEMHAIIVPDGDE